MGRIIWPKENGAPIEHFSEEFYNDFNAAKNSTKGKVDRFLLRWLTSGSEPSYQIKIELNKQIFFITCEPKKVRLGFKVRTNTILKMIGGSDMAVKDYDDVEYNMNCDEALDKFFQYYTLFLDCKIKEVELVLPDPDNLESGWRKNFLRADNLTLTVHGSKDNPYLINVWLTKLDVQLVQSLTINSPHPHFYLKENKNDCRTLKYVKSLIINGRAIMNLNVLSEFEGSSIVYNDENNQSPISLKDFVLLWKKYKEKEYSKIKLVFNAKHSISEWDKLKKSIEYDGSQFEEEENGTLRIAAPKRAKYIRTFEVSEKHLKIEVSPRVYRK